MIDQNRRTEAMRAALMMAAAAVSFAVVFSVAITHALAAEDGQTTFNNACRTCHSMNADDNRLGPTLNGVVGRKAGTAEGFAYSPAMKDAGITWDEATLDKFIAAPDAVVSGNTMKPFTGITNQAERKTIIDYLKSANANGSPKPAE